MFAIPSQEVVYASDGGQGHVLVVRRGFRGEEMPGNQKIGKHVRVWAGDTLGWERFRKQLAALGG